MSWPSIDHSFISPNGRISDRARKEYMKRFTKELFGEEGMPAPTCRQPSKKESYLRQARELRDLAARGMKPRAYIKQAEMLEELARKEANNGN